MGWRWWMMKRCSSGAYLCAAAVLAMGCNTSSRYRVLSFFFDGVPAPEIETVGESAALQAALPAAAPLRYAEHGPYAARLCDACHQSGASNALIVPVERLCVRCHEIKLERRYVHGPLASGGCTACHDPHSSPHPYLLVSSAGGSCLHCHERESVTGTAPHIGVAGDCTSCHDAHMSDRKFLLK